MKRAFTLVLFELLLAPLLFGQSAVVTIGKNNVPPNSNKTAANADTVMSATDRGGTLHILYDTNTNGKTTLIAGVSATKIYVRFIEFSNDSASSVTVTFGTGTGTNCVTTFTAISPAYLLDGTSATAIHGYVLGPTYGNGSWFQTATNADNLCVQTSAGVQLRIVGGADQF
jgi:hypothetical protein